MGSLNPFKGATGRDVAVAALTALVIAAGLWALDQPAPMLGYAAVCVGALAHYLVGAACRPAAHAHGWAAQADPDHLIPPPLRRPGVLVVVDTTDRVAPPREASPEVRRG